jgi:hypothetical protein
MVRSEGRGHGLIVGGARSWLCLGNIVLANSVALPWWRWWLVGGLDVRTSRWFGVAVAPASRLGELAATTVGR